MATNGIHEGACWFCGQTISGARARVEVVIQARSAAEGGPFQTLSCPSCRTVCGALRNRLGAWMFYPLEGSDEPTLIDRLVPRTSRAHLERARRWWLRNAGNVERFRRARPAPPPQAPPPTPPTPRARKTRRATSQPAPAPVTGPRAVLGVAADARLADVRRAWRIAVKRWHPDRIPTKDPVVLLEAERRFREIRAAYEALVAELS